MNVDVKVWSNEDCKESYGRSAPGGITDHMLCAGGNDKGSCFVSSIFSIIVLQKSHAMISRATLAALYFTVLAAHVSRSAS